MEKSILVVDCQNDFINGSLSCLNGDEVVKNIVSFINLNENAKVFYSCDWHKKSNKSFKVNGGIWPVHCVENTLGSRLHQEFYENVKKRNQSANNKKNIFFKGMDDCIEEYSAFNAKNYLYENLNEKLKGNIIICGIALEYCVKETILQLLNNGFNVYLYLKGVGYITKEGYEDTLTYLKDIGVKFI